jgi:hypothetical protein
MKLHGGSTEGSMVGGRRMRDEWMFRKCPFDVVAAGRPNHRTGSSKHQRSAGKPFTRASKIQYTVLQLQWVIGCISNSMFTNAKSSTSPPNGSDCTRRAISRWALISVRRGLFLVPARHTAFSCFRPWRTNPNDRRGGMMFSHR